MKRLTACAALALLLASCAGNQNAAGGAAVPLVIARVKDAVILDPAQATDGMSLNLTQEMMKGLVEFKLGTFDVTPSIAQSWKMTAGGLNWTFALKKGLKFSDGTPIDAAAEAERIAKLTGGKQIVISREGPRKIKLPGL